MVRLEAHLSILILLSTSSITEIVNGRSTLTAPTIVMQPYSTVTLTVVANGESLNYQWFKEGNQIVGATRATLTLEDVTLANEGIYNCFISNRAGNITTETVFLSIFTSQMIFVAVPPTVPVGGDVFLTCNITSTSAQPVETQIVRIMANGEKVVVANETFSMKRTFQVAYMLNNVAFPEDDGAVFQCQANKNTNELRVQNVTIIVQGPPDAIDHENNVSAQLVSLNSVNITWHVPVDNNAPITSYALTFCAMVLPHDADCDTLINITVSVDILTRIEETQLMYTYSELLTEALYEVVIRAENSVGMQMVPVLSNGFHFNSSFPDDGQVVNASFIPTADVIIVTWKLPTLALATANLNVSFDVMYFSDDDPNNTTLVTVNYNSSQLEQGFSASLMTGSGTHTFQIVAVYINPSLLSSEITLMEVRTLAQNTTLLTGPQAIVTDYIDDHDVLTISWPTPSNTIFLVVYHISFTTSSPGSSIRKQSQTSSLEVASDTTSTQLPFTAFTDYMVVVDAVYAPPPNGNRVFVNLLPPTTFTTPERASSPPLNIKATTIDVLKINLSWIPPSDPRGNITAYRITVDRTTSEDVDGVTIMYLSQEFIPNTSHTFEIHAINGFGIGEPGVLVASSSFDVVSPVITNTTTGNAEAPRFMITIDPFSSRYGGLGIYKVVVVRNNRIDPASIPDSHLRPADNNNPFNYYVAYYGDTRQQFRSTFIIGDNTVTTDGNTIYTNPPLEIRVDYYIFIRLYSSIDPLVFKDSELTGVLTIGFIECPNEVDTTWGITWPRTLQGSTSIQTCPRSHVSAGNSTRFCGSDGQWGEVNVLNCTSSEFVELEEILANEVLSNPEPEKQINIVDNVTQKLIQATEPQNQSLLPNDLEASTRILTVIVDVLENNNATNEDVIEVINNILDDTNTEGWRSLQSAGLMTSGELLLHSAERYAELTAMSANISGENTTRLSQSRLNIVVVGEQYQEPPIIDIQFPLESDLVNYTRNENVQLITIPSSLVQERLKEAGNDGNVPVFFLLLRNLPLMGIFTSNTSIRSDTTCTIRQLRTEGAADVISAQVGSMNNNISDSESLQDTPVHLQVNFTFPTNSTLEFYRCVYWNFSEPVGNGSWITTGITTKIQNTIDASLTPIVCESTHLTSFAVLVDVVGGLEVIDVAERKALQIVSYIGCAISIICLLATILFLSWLSCDQWRSPNRKKAKFILTFIHLNLAASLLLALTVFVGGIETVIKSEIGCSFIAGLLHYLFLCAFCWMLCEGIMLFLLFRVIFITTIKQWWFFMFMIIGYLTPLPIVAISVGIRYEYYGVRDSCNELLYCWISVDKGTIFGFVAPMLAIVLINAVFMILALQTLWRVKREKNKEQNESKFQASVKLGRALLVASFVLLPLLGLTWAFGILTVNANSTVFAWLFTIFNSLQGMFIFFFHVIQDDKIKSKISRKLQTQTTGTRSYETNDVASAHDKSLKLKLKLKL